MRKFLWLFCITIFTLSGCQKVDNENKISNGFKFGYNFINTEKGSYILNNRPIENTNMDFQMLFYDKDSEVIVPLCPKINCKHNNKDCLSYDITVLNNDESTEYILFSYLNYNEKLILAYTSISDGGIKIMEANEDGTNKKLLLDISEEAQSLNVFAIYKDKLIISYNVPLKDELERVVGTSTINKMATYDLSDKEFKVFANENEEEYTMTYAIGGNQKNIYYTIFNFSDIDNTKYSIYSYDVSTEKTILISDDYKFNPTVMYDNKLYNISEDGNFIESYDVVSKKVENVIEVSKPISKLEVDPENGLLILSYMDSDNIYYNQVYDLKSKNFVFDDFEKDFYVIGENSGSYFLSNSKNEILLYNKDEKQTKKLY